MDEIVHVHRCPVCRYAHLFEEPWADDAPSDEICPSCGTHFGYDDAGPDRSARHRELQARWRAQGSRWFSRGRPAPPGWNADAQHRDTES